MKNKGVSIYRNKILTGSFDKTARLWDVEYGKEEQIYWGHSGEVVDVKLSPDELSLATASLDYTAKIFQTATGIKFLNVKNFQNILFFSMTS